MPRPAAPVRGAMQLRLAVLCSLTACASPPPAAPSPTTACAPALPLLAQQHTRNVTRLYLAPASLDTTLHLGAPVPATARTGFVSQPAFTPDGAGLYFTWRPDGSQADIWYRDLRTAAEHPVTCTSTEEYSARPIDGGLSVIRVEPDLTRHVVRLTADGRARDTLFPNQPNIGAYTWLDATTAALFIPPTPPATETSLVLADTRTPTLTPLVTQLDPGVAVIPGSHDLSYVDHADPDHLRLMRLDLATRATTLIAPLPDRFSHIAWLPDGSYLAFLGTRIFRATPDAPQYTLVADLAGRIDGALTSITLSPDRTRVALVTSLP
jgi:hypothetical protein